MNAALTIDITEEDLDDDPCCLGCDVWFSEIAWHRVPPSHILGENHALYGCPTDGCSGRIRVHSSVEPADGPMASPPQFL